MTEAQQRQIRHAVEALRGLTWKQLRAVVLDEARKATPEQIMALGNRLCQDADAIERLGLDHRVRMHQ